MAWPVVLGMMSMASSMADSAEENDQMRQRAQSHGIRSGGINFARDRHTMAIEEQSKLIGDNADAQERFLEMRQAEAEADARVTAAAAGVAGDNVDQVINQTERNAGEAVVAVQEAESQAKRQVQADRVDNVVNAEVQKGHFDSTADRSAGAVKAGLSFIQGYRLGI